MSKSPAFKQRVKVYIEGHPCIRRFTLCNDQKSEPFSIPFSFDTFKKTVLQICEIDNKNNGAATGNKHAHQQHYHHQQHQQQPNNTIYDFKYLDEEEDWVSFSSEFEFQDCMRHHDKNKVLRVLVTRENQHNNLAQQHQQQHGMHAPTMQGAQYYNSYAQPPQHPSQLQQQHSNNNSYNNYNNAVATKQKIAAMHKQQQMQQMQMQQQQQQQQHFQQQFSQQQLKELQKRNKKAASANNVLLARRSSMPASNVMQDFTERVKSYFPFDIALTKLFSAPCSKSNSPTNSGFSSLATNANDTNININNNNNNNNINNNNNNNNNNIQTNAAAEDSQHVDEDDDDEDDEIGNNTSNNASKGNNNNNNSSHLNTNNCDNNGALNTSSDEMPTPIVCSNQSATIFDSDEQVMANSKKQIQQQQPLPTKIISDTSTTTTTTASNNSDYDDNAELHMALALANNEGVVMVTPIDTTSKLVQQKAQPSNAAAALDMEKWQTHLNILREMGFTNNELNVRLLHKHTGNIQRVVDDYISGA